MRIPKVELARFKDRAFIEPEMVLCHEHEDPGPCLRFSVDDGYDKASICMGIDEADRLRVHLEAWVKRQEQKDEADDS